MSQKMTYKEAFEELQEILSAIENEEVDVDDLSKKVSRAAVLLKVCSDKLKKTEADVEKILETIKQDEHE